MMLLLLFMYIVFQFAAPRSRRVSSYYSSYHSFTVMICMVHVESKLSAYFWCVLRGYRQLGVLVSLLQYYTWILTVVILAEICFTQLCGACDMCAGTMRHTHVSDCCQMNVAAEPHVSQPSQCWVWLTTCYVLRLLGHCQVQGDGESDLLVIRRCCWC